MSILKSLQEYLQTFEGMEMQPILPDMPDKKASSYALAPSGDGETITDIIGNKTYIKNYVFYAKENARNTVDKWDTYDFLEAFTEWLEEQDDEGNYPDLGKMYEVEELKVSNAMLFDIEENGTGVYQVQIQLRITKRRKGRNE